jgi:hypothetical protein
VISVTLNGVVFSPACGPEKTGSAPRVAGFANASRRKHAQDAFIVLEELTTFARRMPACVFAFRGRRSKFAG